MEEELVARSCSVLLDAILSETTLVVRGILLANSSVNTVVIASFWSSVNGFAADGGARGVPLDVFGEGCREVVGTLLPPVTLPMMFMALEAVAVRSART